MYWRTAVFFVLAFSARGASASAPGYAGMAACAKCHAEIHRQWTHSRHSKMVQPAPRVSVKGDFNAGSGRLRDLT